MIINNKIPDVRIQFNYSAKPWEQMADEVKANTCVYGDQLYISSVHSSPWLHNGKIYTLVMKFNIDDGIPRDIKLYTTTLTKQET